MKNYRTYTYLSFLNIIFFLTPFTSAHSLEDAINSQDRSPKNVARDQYRNPYKTLSFFEIKQDMKIVELSPGSGWYTEILANYIHSPGMLTAAHFDKNSDRDLVLSVQSQETDRIENFGYKSSDTGFMVGTRFEHMEDFFIQPNFEIVYELCKLFLYITKL